MSGFLIILRIRNNVNHPYMKMAYVLLRHTLTHRVQISPKFINF